MVGTRPADAARLRPGRERDRLTGYRHPRYAAAAASTGDALLEVFAEPGPLMAGARQVGDPIAALPALFHLMWAHQLVSDLSLRLDAGSTVAAGA